MSSNVTIDSVFKSEAVDSYSILRLNKPNIMLEIKEIKVNEAKSTQKEPAKTLRCSDSTSMRYTNDINLGSLYKSKETRRSSVSFLDLIHFEKRD